MSRNATCGETAATTRREAAMRQNITQRGCEIFLKPI